MDPEQATAPDGPDSRKGTGVTMEDDSSGELVRLVRAVQDGDRDAFGRLYALTSARVYGLIRSMTVDERAAQQVLQEVYVAVWQRSRTYNETSCTPAKWIFALARTLAGAQTHGLV